MSPHNHVLTVGVSFGPLILWMALLAAVPVVAGFALLRGFLGEPDRGTALAVTGVAAGAVLLELMLAGELNLPAQAVPLILAALAGPLYVLRSRNPRFTARLRWVAPWVLGLAALIALTQFARAWLGGDRPAAATAGLLHTGLVLALTGLAWFVVCRPDTRNGVRLVRVTAMVLAVAVAGGVAQAAALRAPAPTPGLATIHQAVTGSAALEVLVVPNRPGWNLVQLQGEGAEVGTAPDNLVRAETRPGATGTWAAVLLPAGRSELWIRYRGALGAVTTDTGTGAPAPHGMTGRDGPECAAAILGAVLGDPAGRAVDRCPADALDPEDAAALRETVDFLAVLGVPSITLVTDDSRRSAEANRVVRAAATAAGILVATPEQPDGPLFVVAGWSTADSTLREVAGGEVPIGGTYLAPWLAAAQMLDIRVAGYIPLRTALDGELPTRYRDALSAGYPGQRPAAAGYRAWLAGQRVSETEPVRIYQVVNGSVVAMSPPL